MKGFKEVNLPSLPGRPLKETLTSSFLSPNSVSLTALDYQKDQAKAARACSSPASVDPSKALTPSLSRGTSPTSSQETVKLIGRCYSSRIGNNPTARDRVLKDAKTKLLPRPKVLGGGPKPVAAQSEPTDQQSVPAAKRAKVLGGGPKPESISDQPLDYDEPRRKARISKFAAQESLSRISILPTFSDFRPPFSDSEKNLQTSTYAAEALAKFFSRKKGKSLCHFGTNPRWAYPTPAST